MRIKDLKPDSRNANKGTAKGQKMIIRSIQEDGFGRSALLDKNNQIIAGNKTTEAAAEVFGVDVEPIIIETDGKRPVYVKRTDLDLDDPHGAARRLAYRDNLSSHFSFGLDAAQVMADIEAGFDFEAIDVGLADLGEVLEKTANALLGPTDPANDPNAEWQGMPEFENEPKAARTLYIHFAQDEDVIAFAELIGQQITDKTKSLWYPFKKDNLHMDKDLRYE